MVGQLQMAVVYKNKIMSKENLKSTNVCYPTKETWFICWDDTRDNMQKPTVV